MEQLGLRQQLAGSENDLPTVTQLKLLTCVAAAQTIRCSATPPSAHETGDHVGWARRILLEIPEQVLYRMYVPKVVKIRGKQVGLPASTLQNIYFFKFITA